MKLSRDEDWERTKEDFRRALRNAPPLNVFLVAVLLSIEITVILVGLAWILGI